MLDWRKIDAVIFDMDGTLVDSMYYWLHLTDKWFARQGTGVPEGINDELATADLQQAAEILLRKYAVDKSQTAEGIFRELQAEIDGHYANDIPLMPYAEDLLRQLSALGKGACIATMTDRPQVETVIRRHNIGDYINFILTTPEVGAGKEQPDIFLRAAARFGAEPSRVLVAEDSRTAAKTAMRAGFPVVIVKTAGYDYAEIDELAAEISAKNFYIDNFSELLPIAKL